MIWTEVEYTTVLGKNMGKIPLKWRIRYRYFEKPYGNNGLRYMRETREWYLPFEAIKNKWRKIMRGLK